MKAYGLENKDMLSKDTSSNFGWSMPKKISPPIATCKRRGHLLVATLGVFLAPLKTFLPSKNSSKIYLPVLKSTPLSPECYVGQTRPKYTMVEVSGALYSGGVSLPHAYTQRWVPPRHLTVGQWSLSLRHYLPSGVSAPMFLRLERGVSSIGGPLADDTDKSSGLAVDPNKYDHGNRLFFELASFGFTMHSTVTLLKGEAAT